MKIILQDDNGKVFLSMDEIEDLDPEEFLCSIEEAVQIEIERTTKTERDRINYDRN